MKSQRSFRNKGQSGLALVTIMWIVLILGLLASSVLVVGRSAASLGSGLIERNQAEFLARAAAETAVFAMINRSGSQTDWQANGSLYGWWNPDAQFRARVSPEIGRIDLNASSESLISAAFRVSGIGQMADEIAAAIIDYRDADSLPQQGGAEDPDYFAANRLLGAKDASFQDVDELLNVLGVNRDIYERVRSMFTVYSGLTSPEPRSAAPIVLAALGAETNLSTQGDDTSEPEPHLGPVPQLIREGYGSLADAGSHYRVEASALIPGGSAHIFERIVLFAQAGTNPYRVIKDTESLSSTNQLQ